MKLSNSDREQVGLVTLSHGLQHLYLGVLPLLYPFLIMDLRVSYSELGAFLALAGLLSGALQGMAGVYRRVSACLVLTMQNLLLAASLAVIAIAPTFAVFGAARLVGAVAASTQHPVGNTVLVRRFPRRCATVLSWHAVGANFATVAAPLLVAVLIASWGWRWTALAFMVPVQIGCLLLAFRLRDQPRSRLERPPSSARPSLRQLPLGKRALGIIAAATIAAGGDGLGVLGAFLPTYLYAGLGLAPVAGSVVVTAFASGGVLGPALAGILADQVGRRRLVLLSYSVAGLALAMFRVAGTGIPALVVLGAVVGILAFSASPLLEALFSEAVHQASLQTAFGVYLAASYGAGSLWVAGLGWTIDRFGVHSILVPIAASFVVAGLVVLVTQTGRGTATR